MTEDEATRVAESIRQHWFEQGYAVKTWIERIPTTGVPIRDGVREYAVRSNLINGLPPKRYRKPCSVRLADLREVMP